MKTVEAFLELTIHGTIHTTSGGDVGKTVDVDFCVESDVSVLETAVEPGLGGIGKAGIHGAIIGRIGKGMKADD